jgi:hypothetical protein
MSWITAILLRLLILMAISLGIDLVRGIIWFITSLIRPYLMSLGVWLSRMLMLKCFANCTPTTIHYFFDATSRHKTMALNPSDSRELGLPTLITPTLSRRPRENLLQV